MFNDYKRSSVVRRAHKLQGSGWQSLLVYVYFQSEMVKFQIQCNATQCNVIYAIIELVAARRVRYYYFMILLKVKNSHDHEHSFTIWQFNNNSSASLSSLSLSFHLCLTQFASSAIIISMLLLLSFLSCAHILVRHRNHRHFGILHTYRV